MKGFLVLLLALPAAAGPSAEVHNGVYDGGRFVKVGSSVVDTTAPGALQTLKMLDSEHSRPVIGLFRLDDASILSAEVLGREGVRGHRDLLPANGDPRAYGGYTFHLAKDGTRSFAGSGTFQAPITPLVKRQILRFNGVKLAAPTMLQRLQDAWYRVADGVAWLLRSA